MQSGRSGVRGDRASVDFPRTRRGAVSVKAVLAVVGAVAGVGVLVWALANSSLFAKDPMVDASRLRPAVDVTTGAKFREFRMPTDDSPPWRNPQTGQDTVWPAELCYWTRDGKATLEPTLVVLNEYLGQSGRTICPDCGREVVRHNPMPPPEAMLEAARAAGVGG